MGMLSRMRRILPALLLVATAPAATAQQGGNAVITGRVLAEDGGFALPGANVVITELGVSIGTNQEGRYTITVPGARVRGQTVVVIARAIGYRPMRRQLVLNAGNSTVDFALARDINQLAQVVVTGVTEATEQRKLPIAVSQVTAREMPVTGANPLTQLQGKVPGANIVSNSGRPGSTPAVLLRGPTSINAAGRGQDPLYIVDGVLLQGPLPDINPADIESMEIVKGAAAASLYGARAGNGVINITTKSGKAIPDGVKFTFSTEAGVSDIENRFPLAERTALMMDETKTYFCEGTTAAPLCDRRIDIRREARRINENGGDFSLPSLNFGRDAGIARSMLNHELAGLFQVDRFRETYDPIAQAVTSSAFVNANIDMAGRVGGKTNFFASFGNLSQEGAIRGFNGFFRNSARLNLDHQFSERWSLQMRSGYSRTTQDGLNQAGGEGPENFSGSGFFRLTRVPAFVNLMERDNRGRLYIRSNPLNQGSQNDNPIYQFENERREDERDRFIGGVTIRFTPLDWLETDANFSYDRSNGGFFFIRDRGFRTTAASPANLGTLTRSAFNNQSFNTMFNAKARRDWAADLRTTVTARYMYEQQDFNGRTGGGDALAVPGLSTLDAVTQNFNISSGTRSIRQVGLFGGFNVDWKDRYILDASYRRDGSSLFGRENRWANFYRGAVAWIASEEPWWFAGDAINEFKLRGSVGTTGNRPNFFAQYETFTIGTGGTLNPNTLGNAQLRPEFITETELGADMELFRRLGVKVTYAQSTAEDQILLVPPSASSGFASQWKNAGTLENKTWELALNLPILTKRDLTYSIGATWDRNRSTILKLDVPPFTGGIGLQAAGDVFLFREGERLGTFYGRDFVRSCNQLPSAYQSQCGGAGAMFQRNDQGYIVWTGGRGIGEGYTTNAWQAQLPSATAPWGARLQWGHPILLRDSTGNPEQVALGNGMPDFRFAVNQNLTWKRLTVYALLDASIGQEVWNQGRHWSLGDLMTSDVDQDPNDLAGAKPLGYYWRAGPGLGGHPAGLGGLYDVLAPNRATVEDASFAKMRELQVSYRVGRIGGTGDWTVGVVGRNLFTITGYSGFDPEVGLAGGQLSSAVLNAIDRFGFPNMRTVTFQLRSSF